MVESDRGFVYPEVNQDTCISCKLCQCVCPSLHPVSKHSKQETVYASWVKDSHNRWFSTSGGMGFLFSKWAVHNGGVFCGCKWNLNHAEHICCESESDLHQFQGSKYAHSDLLNVLVEIKQYLEKNRLVLFIGTPCQVAGLKSYLRKDYTRLYTVELLCHGIPSSLMLRERIGMVEQMVGSTVTDIRFRHKLKNQYSTCMRYSFEDGTLYQCSEFEDFFIRGFEANYFLRDNCFDCKYATPERVADITIADFWGYRPRSLKFWSYIKGNSLVITNTDKGKYLFDQVGPLLKKDIRQFSDALMFNPNLQKPQSKPDNYDLYWNKYFEGVGLSELQEMFFPPVPELRFSALNRIKQFIKIILHRVK